MKLSIQTMSMNTLIINGRTIVTNGGAVSMVNGQIMVGGKPYVADDAPVAVTTDENGNYIHGASTVVGRNNRVIGDGHHVVGNNNEVTGSNNRVNGNNNDVSGRNNLVRGRNNDVSGVNNIVYADNVDISGVNQKINAPHDREIDLIG